MPHDQDPILEIPGREFLLPGAGSRLPLASRLKPNAPPASHRETCQPLIIAAALLVAGRKSDQIPNGQSAIVPSPAGAVSAVLLVCGRSDIVSGTGTGERRRTGGVPLATLLAGPNARFPQLIQVIAGRPP